MSALKHFADDAKLYNERIHTFYTCTMSSLRVSEIVRSFFFAAATLLLLAQRIGVCVLFKYSTESTVSGIVLHTLLLFYFIHLSFAHCSFSVFI